MTPFLLELAAILLVAAIVATFGYSSGKRALQKKINDASVAYVAGLDDLISKSVSEGKFKASVNAREIVGRCDAMKERLESILKPLSASFAELIRLAAQGERGNADEVFAAITALQASWPSQRRSIETETRRLLGLLGVE
jgi:hypothetical protein